MGPRAVYVLPFVVLGVAFFAWSACAHFGLDRVLGYGRKHPTSFSDTDLGRIGWR
jgi:hypothetical protein